MRRRHRLVRLALGAFPPHFRDRYGAVMLNEYAARHDEIRATRGAWAARGLALNAARELVTSGIRERLVPRHRPSPSDHPEHSRMHAILADFRYALRALRRRPAFALVAVVTLGVGIGASTAMFSIANGVVLQPLPYPEPDRLVRVYDTFVERGAMSGTSSPANFADWRTQARSLSALASYNNTTLTYTGTEPAMPLSAVLVSHEWTEVLRTSPALGRGFTLDDETFGNHRVVILSHGLWQRQFGGDPAIVGRSVSMEGQAYTVVGVMPAGFAFPTPQTELWAPLAYDFDVAGSRGVHYIAVIGRLAPGATITAAGAEMSLLMEQLRQAYPEQLRGWGVRLVSLHESIVGGVRQRVLVFLGAVGLLLLVACVNVANLSLAHAVTRFRELAVRAAMGASRWRLTRQMAFEGLVVAILAGALGTVIASMTVDFVVALAPGSVPRLYAVDVDRTVLAFVTAISLAIGVLVGTVPALRAARRDLFDTLREGTRSGTGRTAHLVRSGFVVAQVALAVVIAVGAGLLVKSFSRLSSVDPGIRTDGILVATVGVPSSRYPDDAERARFLLDYVERLRQVPGVTAAAASSQLPLEGYSISFTYWPASGRDLPMNERASGDFRVVSPGYFETMAIPVLRGRTFDARDQRDGAPVIMIDRALAEATFGADDPIGQYLTVGTGDEPPQRQVVGVVENVRQRALDVPVQPGYYLPLSQVTWSTQRIVIRTDLPPMALADAMRQELAAMDPLIPVRNVSTLNDLAARSVVVPRFNTLLLGAFASIALILAASGIYSVMSYSVTQRTREIGVRMALGAQATQVRLGVWRRGLVLGLIGASIGIAIAFAMAPQVATLLYEVDVHDPVSFALPPLAFLVVAWLGSYVPARRASRVDPVVALRSE
jgi:putative ABC transport system permease protein